MSARQYAVVAKRDGGNEMRYFHSFGSSAVPEHLIEMINKRLIMEPEFKERWTGWIFCILLTDTLLKVTKEGKVMMFKNSKETLK